MNKKAKIHVRIGDKVKVISGKQKGFLGTISSITTKKSTVTLDGIEERIIYRKAPEGKNSVKLERPISIHTSNVMLWDKQGNQISRIGYKLLDGKKTRYFKKSGLPV